MEYQCYNGVNDICPSDISQGGCYKQSENWAPGVDVTCSMDNAQCLNVSCSASGLNVFLREDLFHTNQHNTDSFADQLLNGDAVLKVNGQAVPLSGPCSFSKEANGIRLDWPYDLCDITPSMSADGKNIIYALSVSSAGNDRDSDSIIEFYVDTTINAECAYPAAVVVDADGFWVNQEDVKALGESEGDLTDQFECAFYAEKKRKNRIKGNNIVNMGVLVYGQIISKMETTGLKYNLDYITMTDSVTGQSFSIVENNLTSKIVKARRQKNKPISENLKFKYMTFGFEDNTDQNQIEISCGIKISLANEVPGLGRSIFGRPALQGMAMAPEGYSDSDYYDD